MTSSICTDLLPAPTARADDKVLRNLKFGTTVAMLVGAGLVAWSAAIHLDLWQTGYRNIPTIGPLFLLQWISGFLLATAIIVFRRSLPALAGAGFLLATLAGLIWSAELGLFGFQESFSAPYAGLSTAVEISGTAVLVSAIVLRVKAVERSRRNAERLVERN